MKKSFLWMIVAVLATVCLGSCSKDDNDNSFGISADAAYLIGKWEGVSSSGWEKFDGKVYEWFNEAETEFEYIEFKFDATGEFKDEGGRTQHFVWYINDDYELVIGDDYEPEESRDVYKFKFPNKDKLVLISEDPDPMDGWYWEDTFRRIE